MALISVNGIHSYGENSTDLVVNALHKMYGYEINDFDYPKASIFTAMSRKAQYRIARDLAQKSQPDDIVIAHSFGCLLTLRAMELGAQYSTVVFMSAAMNADFTFPYLGCKQLLNIHNPADKALWIARITKFGDLGDMGASGYAGPIDPRITNHMEMHTTSGTLNHMHYFKGEHPRRLARLINKFHSGGQHDV